MVQLILHVISLVEPEGMQTLQLEVEPLSQIDHVRIADHKVIEPEDQEVPMETLIVLPDPDMEI